MSYVRPVDPTGISSWLAHTRRDPPSKEAGVDYYCVIGTEIHAAGDGSVVETGGSIDDATGRYVTVDLDDGRRVRYLHLSRYRTSTGNRVRRGDVIAESGASGYGSEFFGASGMADFPWRDTGGPHVHVTLWPRQVYSFGARAGTLDFDAHADADFTLWEDDMFTDADRNLLQDVSNKLSIPDAPYGRPEVIQQRVDSLSQAVSRVAAGQILYPGARYYAFQAVVDAVRRGGDAEPPIVEVDEVALAQALAPLLPAHMASLSDADVDRLAQAAAAEQGKRTRRRLG